jgi:sec-independent protein translocase protein TatB
MLASPMLLEGSEWLIVVVLIGAVLVFGPDKIPQIAKQVGRARAEFDKASNEARSMMDTAMKSIDQETAAARGSLNAAANDMKSSFESTANEVKSSFESTANDMKSSFDGAVASARAPAVAPQPGDASNLPPASFPPAPGAAEAQGAASAPMANEVDADALLKLAHRMGIATDGKTRDEISEEIFSKSASQAKP